MSHIPADVVETLKEPFVLARLGQPNLFVRRDVEAWLRTQAVAETPDCEHAPSQPDPTCVWCRAWAMCPCLCGDQETVMSMLARATEPSQIETALPRLPTWASARELFRSFTGATFRFGRNRFVLITFPRGGGSYVVSPMRDKADVSGDVLQWQPLTQTCVHPHEAIVDILLSEWTRRGPASLKARDLLIALMQQAVRTEREKAEKDFDAAVAVSEDGQRIVKATWVVVYDDKKDRLTFHRPEWFARNKLVIEPGKGRESDRQLACDLERDPTPRLAWYARDVIRAQIISPQFGPSLANEQMVISPGVTCDPLFFVPLRCIDRELPPAIRLF